jgi:hypothetical protein
MKIIPRFILLAAIIGVTTLHGFAQPGIKNIGRNDSIAKTEWDLTLDYYTRSVFLGRTDTVGSGYYMPAFAVNLKCGLFFMLDFTLFQQNTVRPYQGLSLTAGYDKTLSDNFAIDFQLIKNSYPSTSARVNSTVTFEAEAALDYINDIVTSEISPQLLINKSALDNTPDYVFTLTESHPFYIYAGLFYKDSLSITPSASVSAGTQNFYFGFVNTELLAEHPKEEAAIKKAANKLAKVASEAKILDYELSLPVSYYLGHLIVTITPLYSIGENVIEKSNPQSIWSADFEIGYRFW